MSSRQAQSMRFEVDFRKCVTASWLDVEYLF